MDLHGFLSTIVPATGLIIVAKRVPMTDAKGKPFNAFAHRYGKSPDAVLSQIDTWDAERSDVYFALASYQQGFHPNPKNPAKKQIRVRSNVEALKALWFDIDFKAGYDGLKAAGQALAAFCRETLLPPPAILVGSGNGLHAYWPFDTPIPLDRWQVLADSLKNAAKDKGLKADLACTGDACRVLRPPFTTNWKDPANPKPVRLLHTSGKTYPVERLESALMPWQAAAKRISPAPSLSTLHDPVYNELTGGLAKVEYPKSRFEEIRKHCGVMAQAYDTQGANATEPEWRDTLQLLKFCEDGEQNIHTVSMGHPGYDPDATVAKFQKRLENSAGPTLCTSFEQYHPAICAKCPRKGDVKTPLQLGEGDLRPVGGMPANYRPAPDGSGTEFMMWMPDATGKLVRQWQRAFKQIFTNLRAARSIVTGDYELQLDVEVAGAKPWRVTIPAEAIGNTRAQLIILGKAGISFKEKEAKHFHNLMSTWLTQLQGARNVAEVTENLGWQEEKGELIGFSCGPTTFYADGRVKDDVRAAQSFSRLAQYYHPVGGLDEWKHVAKFITEQNNPAFTSILAASFGAPLLRFTGLPGGILAIVSSESGVGKSSALKTSAAVWGSPAHSVNAVDDTPKSVARKLGFLKNLPAYWDELRGRKTIEEFLTLAFQVTQGKERSRLNSAAQLQDVSTWETLLIVAANDSIFDAMARGTVGSDAGVKRTFEMVVAPFGSARNRAEIALLFERLNKHHGQAGRVYAEYLATHHKWVVRRVEDVFIKLSTAGKMQAPERFWFAIIAILVVGAELAAKLDLCKIDIRSMTAYLMKNLNRLRSRSEETMSTTDPLEVLAQFIQAYQDRSLTVARFPAPRQNFDSYVADVSGGVPSNGKLMIHASREEKLLRFPITGFTAWAESRGLPAFSLLKQMVAGLNMKPMKVQLGAGTGWALPRQRCYEVSTVLFSDDLMAKAAVVTADDSSRLDDSPDSLPDSAP